MLPSRPDLERKPLPAAAPVVGQAHLSEASVAGNGVNHVAEHLADTLPNVIRVGPTALTLGLPRVRQKGLRFEQELAPDGLGVGMQQPSQHTNLERLARHKGNNGMRRLRNMHRQAPHTGKTTAAASTRW